MFFVLLYWLGWFVSVFTGFTFTDWQDFGPITLLLVGAGVAIFLGTHPEARIPLLLKIVLFLLALWPLFADVGLYFLAREVQKIGGGWPQPMVDDPKGYVGSSAGYDRWYHTVAYLEAYAGAAMAIFPALLWVGWKRLSNLTRYSLIATCGGAMLVFIFDPGALYTWWLD